jgi:hypothetical protein
VTACIATYLVGGEWLPLPRCHFVLYCVVEVFCLELVELAVEIQGKPSSVLLPLLLCIRGGQATARPHQVVTSSMRTKICLVQPEGKEESLPVAFGSLFLPTNVQFS